MGANSSSISELNGNEYLRGLAGPDTISDNDPFWNQLLSFSFVPPQSSSDYRLLEEATHNICKAMAHNNINSGNFGALVSVFLKRAAELKTSTQCENNLFTWQTYNALFIVRCLCKYFIENMSEESVMKQFNAWEKTAQQGTLEEEKDKKESLVDKLLNALVEIIVDVPVVNFTYNMTMEAMNTLIILCSVQIFKARPTAKSTIFRYLMQGKCSIHACLLVKTLLQHYVRQEKAPDVLQTGGGSYIIGFGQAVASGLWSMLTLGYGKASPQQEESLRLPPLSNHSLLLLLILTNHCTSDKSLPNPYRQALFSFTDSHEQGEASAPLQAVATFKTEYAQLFDGLAATLVDDQTTLLLYLLMHKNPQFKSFVLSRTSLDAIVMPILKILYGSQERNSHHIYMALIVILILSEDDFFNKAIHEINIKSVTWYTERHISDVTLGGLLVLVLIRTIQFNMTRMRDKYLHTNCLAALANMSSQFQRLHPYVSQRIVGVFETLARRHAKVLERVRDCVQRADGEDEGEDEAGEQMQDLAILEEVLRMVLEIINSCLMHSLQHNPNLVYTLLYNKQLFAQFRTHPTFQDILQNIDTVLNYFSTKLEEGDKNLSPEQVLEIIHQGALKWPRDRLKKFPELKFKYVEEDQPEEFFIPYVWSLVYQSSDLYWNPTLVQLFTLQT
ncbi:PREDICTED: dymeclin-like [Priapulus caudatus]|uniref:Dymeclin n=1 Tax=Priapulus caudatus TaxID=37621 RepID=A0ABM1F8B9_PRICU|nr:PREDICTED: dymeclin-like [Priapulus caudatus]